MAKQHGFEFGVEPSELWKAVTFTSLSGLVAAKKQHRTALKANSARLIHRQLHMVKTSPCWTCKKSQQLIEPNLSLLHTLAVETRHGDQTVSRHGRSGSVSDY